MMTKIVPRIWIFHRPKPGRRAMPYALLGASAATALALPTPALLLALASGAGGFGRGLSIDTQKKRQFPWAK
jgi:hypothetical protein